MRLPIQAKPMPNRRAPGRRMETLFGTHQTGRWRCFSARPEWDQQCWSSGRCASQPRPRHPPPPRPGSCETRCHPTSGTSQTPARNWTMQPGLLWCRTVQAHGHGSTVAEGPLIRRLNSCLVRDQLVALLAGPGHAAPPGLAPDPAEQPEARLAGGRIRQLALCGSAWSATPLEHSALNPGGSSLDARCISWASGSPACMCS